MAWIAEEYKIEKSMDDISSSMLNVSHIGTSIALEWKKAWLLGILINLLGVVPNLRVCKDIPG
jgi:hypothetical protein